MSARPELRPYQETTIDVVKPHRRAVVAMPTGSGKTVTFAAIVERMKAEHRNSAALIVAHRREIIMQTSRKLHDIGIVHGIIMAGIEPRPTLDVQVASIQTLARRRERMQMPPADLVIIDEAHHARAETYRQLIDDYPHAQLLGWTATPERGDGQGLGGDLFDVLIVGSQVPDLIALGFLVPTKVYAPYTPNLEGVKKIGGDYISKQLENRLNKPKLTADIVEQWLIHGERRPTVVFASGVGHSVSIRDDFLAANIRAAHIDAKTPKDERDAALAQLARGEITVLCNFGVLTEGWDCPEVGCCILARPTAKHGLYRQMIGRTLRPAPGKADAIILDHAGSTFLHGFAEDRIDWTLSPQAKAARNTSASKHNVPGSRILACTECGALRTAGHPCSNCGFMPVTRPRYVFSKAGELSLIDRERRVAPNEWTHEHKLDFYGQLAAIAHEREYKPGFAAIKFKERFGVWPPLPRGVSPTMVPPTPEVRAWVRASAKAWKAQQRQPTAQNRGAA